MLIRIQTLQRPLRAILEKPKKPRTFCDHMWLCGIGIPEPLQGAYLRSLARTHRVPKTGSATASTITPAGKPT